MYQVVVRGGNQWQN